MRDIRTDSNDKEYEPMERHMTHFKNLADAKNAIAATYAHARLEFTTVREGFAVWTLRGAGSLAIYGKLYEGRDAFLFITA